MRLVYGQFILFALFLSIIHFIYPNGLLVPEADYGDDIVKWDYKPYFSTHYNKDTGLPFLNMEKIIQDRFGFLYFSTSGMGLYKYDGHSWRQLSRDTAALADDRVLDMIYDGKDRIYLAHPVEQVSVLNILEEKAVIMGYKAPRNQEADVSRILIYPDGVLCLATATQGMITLEIATGKQTYFGGSNPKLNIFGGGWQNISATFIDSTGRCWFGTAKGVSLFDGQEFYRYFPYSDGAIRDVRQIAEGEEGKLFVFTDRSIYTINEESGFVELAESLSAINGRIKNFRAARNGCFVIDAFGRWFYGSSGGIIIHDPSMGDFFNYVAERNDLVSDALNMVFKDRESNIWVLTENGVTKLRPAIFQNYYKIRDIDIANVYYTDTSSYAYGITRPRFRNSRKGTWLYFKDDYFLAELFRDGYRIMDFRSLNKGPILTRILLYQESVYIAPFQSPTYFRYYPQEGRFKAAGQQLSTPAFMDYKGKIFRFYTSDISPQQYLSVTDKGTGNENKFRISADIGLQSDKLDIFIDREDENRIWVTQFRHKALAYFYDIEAEKLSFWGVEGELNNIMDTPADIQNIIIWPDYSGSFWVLYSSAFSRVFHYEKGTLAEYTEKLRLKGKAITDMKVDADRRLLLATENEGLFIYDGEVCFNYSTAEGLSGNRLSGGISISRDGGIFVMSGTVLSKLDDSVLQEPVFDLKFIRAEDIDERIQDLSLLSSMDGVTCPLGLRNISVYVSANTYLAERDITYSFRYVDKNEKWQKERSSNYINLTALSPGTHEIQARVTDHLNRFQECFFRFTIPPFWYETVIARIGFVIGGGALISLLVVFFVLWNGRRLRKRAKELQQIIKERTAQLKETQQELLEAARSAGRGDIAAEVLHTIGNVLNSIAIQIEQADSLIKKNLTGKLTKTNELVIAEGLSSEETSPRLKKVLEYYAVLGREMEKERTEQMAGIKFLQQKMELLTYIVQKQNEYASFSYYNESVNLMAVAEDTFSFLINELQGITVVKMYSKEEVVVKGQKAKILYILISLVRNAIEAVNKMPGGEKQITVEIKESEKKQILLVKDNGIGISKENLVSVFNMDQQKSIEPESSEVVSDQEHSIRRFNLHTCANFMTEMGGYIRVESEGAGKGSTFILEW